MSVFRSILTIMTLLILCNCKSDPEKDGVMASKVMFKDGAGAFTPKEKEHIKEQIHTSEKEIRNLLPNLPDSITVTIEIVDWNLDMVGGVTGRTETNSPPHVAIQISSTFPDGIIAMADNALRRTVFHEFHHLHRGWAIQDNVYGPGIATAAVNEGLAVVFSEEYANLGVLEADTPPEESIADAWMKEILELPINAEYRKWMFEHPDGRLAIGYRAGNFLIRRAMGKSGKDIITLSTMSPKELLKMGGY